MAAEETRQASAEIEVTPAMEMAGMLALDGYDPDFNDRETAAKVYRAMEATRRNGHDLQQQRQGARSANKDAWKDAGKPKQDKPA